MPSHCPMSISTTALPSLQGQHSTGAAVATELAQPIIVVLALQMKRYLCCRDQGQAGICGCGSDWGTI